MRYIDCFNGDADGICALTQYRLAQPVDIADQLLVTGVKRDINLLKQVNAKPSDVVSVFDVSLDKNRDGLNNVLNTGAQVLYCDHHFAGDIPQVENLHSIINTTADVCTSLLINQYLKNAYLEWAVVGTFGDNLDKSAISLAKPLGFSEGQLAQLKKLGIYLNYNGYGSQFEDLYFHPAQLYKRTVLHATPTEFMCDDSKTFQTLETGYQSDMANAQQSEALAELESVAVFMLPNQAWARRVSGVFGNQLANQNPNRAHAVVTQLAEDEYMLSVRAPLLNKQGADVICRQFDTGGGRAAAAGINKLNAQQLDKFIQIFTDYYQAQ